MESIKTYAHMQEADTLTIETYGIPAVLLTEQAGLLAFEMLEQHEGRQDGVLFVCGKGNNGTDALVAARAAACRGWDRVSAVCMRAEEGSLAYAARGYAASCGVTIIDAEDPSVPERIASAPLIVDGLLGIGCSRPIEPESPVGRLISLINSSGARRCSLDVPSGLTEQPAQEDLCITAELTITFATRKRSMYTFEGRPRCGKIVCVNPGFPQQVLSIKSTYYLDPSPKLPLRGADGRGYKNTKGHVVIFAGSEGYSGAAALCAQAALRCGCGLVTLYVDRAIYRIVATKLTSVIVRPLDEGQLITAEKLDESYDAALCGPGWSEDERNSRQLEALLAASIPLVLDASAIRMLSSGHLERIVKRQRVLVTPHPGEFRALERSLGLPGGADLFEAMLSLTASGIECLYTSWMNYICTSDSQLYIQEGNNPFMGTAGSGDVLSGIVTSLLAQGYGSELAMRVGNHVHQRCGRLASHLTGPFIAEDLLEVIPAALRPVAGYDSLDLTGALD